MLNAPNILQPQDHHVVVDENDGNDRYLSIPGGPEVINYLAGCSK